MNEYFGPRLLLSVLKESSNIQKSMALQFITATSILKIQSFPNLNMPTWGERERERDRTCSVDDCRREASPSDRNIENSRAAHPCPLWSLFMFKGNLNLPLQILSHKQCHPLHAPTHSFKWPCVFENPIAVAFHLEIYQNNIFLFFKNYF